MRKTRSRETHNLFSVASHVTAHTGPVKKEEAEDKKFDS